MGIKTESSRTVLDGLYKEINMLALNDARNNSLPYTEELPFPEDMNVVNGKHLGDINKIHLELKAGAIGAKSLKWIYGADAALAGLEVKSGQEPILAVANIMRNGKAETDIQSIYLLDQFTEKSLERIFSPEKIEEKVLSENSEKAKKQIKIITQNMLKNISEYDSGIKEAKTREAMRKNIKNIYSKNNPAIGEVTETKKNLFESYLPQQKTIFTYLNSYYTQQKSGIVFQNNLTPEEKQKRTSEFINAVKELAEMDSPLLAQTLSESYFFAERTTHLGFSPERIFTQEDRTKEQNVLAPKAAELQKKEPEKIKTREKEVERLRSNSRQIKPPTRGH